MHFQSIGNWFCGPEGLFGLHFGGFFHIIFWIVCLMLLFTLFRAFFTNKNDTAKVGHSTSALSILEERYATGEIDQEEFLEKKKDLK